MIRGL